MKTLFFLFCATVCSAVTPAEVSKWNIPGQRAPGACAKYAFCLNYRLASVGVESLMLGYDWNHKAKSRGHAMVLFRIENQWYGIDNERDTARPVKGDTDLARVQSFDRRAFRVRPINFGGDYARLAKLASGQD